MDSSLGFRLTFFPGLLWGFLPPIIFCLELRAQSLAVAHCEKTLSTPRVGMFLLPLSTSSASCCRLRGCAVPARRPWHGRVARGGSRQPAVPQLPRWHLTCRSPQNRSPPRGSLCPWAGGVRWGPWGKRERLPSRIDIQHLCIRGTRNFTLSLSHVPVSKRTQAGCEI